MSINSCYACHTVLDEEKAACPVCGMPRLRVIGENEDAKNMIKKIAEEHRQNKLQDATISILAYEYEENEGKLREKAVHTIEIAKALELVYGETTWFSGKFARIDSNREMELSVVIKKSGSELTTINLQFIPPKMEDFWYIGVKLIEGFCIVFQIGNEQVHTQTEKISLI